MAIPSLQIYISNSLNKLYFLQNESFFQSNESKALIRLCAIRLKTGASYFLSALKFLSGPLFLAFGIISILKYLKIYYTMLLL